MLDTDKIRGLTDKLKKESLTLVLAESCTCGLVSSLIAEIPGISSVLWGSFVCYTQEAKVSMLGIKNDSLLQYGIVSAQTAKAMAEGALQKSNASIAASCTGLAGPNGDGSSTPVGTVWIAAATKGKEPLVKEYHFNGSRNEIRKKAAIAVLDIVELFLKGINNGSSSTKK
ncbi:MAG: CinA family protein [Treponema sp.]|jgi:PncC family amidohydrolase|nr:CinA family protein [Treponema sp.]